MKTDVILNMVPMGLLFLAMVSMTNSQSSKGYRYTKPKEPQEVCKTDCSMAMDLAFVIDASGSIQREDEKGTGRNTNWDEIMNFIIQIIDQFNVGAGQTRVGMMTFSTNANIRIPFNGFYDKRDLRSEIQKKKKDWYVGGWTNMYDALRLMNDKLFTEELGDRSSIPDVVIFLSDGKSSHHNNSNFQDPIPQAARAEEKGIKIYVIGVTDSVYEFELEAISAQPKKKGESYWLSPTFQSLMGEVEGLLKSTCTETCTQKVSGCAADITFVLDASGSIRDKNPRDRSYDNWELMLDFVEDIVKQFDISDEETRVAVVTFSNNATLRFKLADSHEEKDVVNALRGQIKDAYNGGETNTHHAIEIMHKESFTPINGDRADKPNIAIILTDGKSYLTPPNGVYTNPMLAAEAAKKQNITILVVGITNDVDEEEIRNISSAPNMKGVSYWTTPNFAEISGVVGTVINSTCTSVQEQTSKFCVVTTCSKTAMDLAIVIDASGSIWKKEEKDSNKNTNWDLIMTFVREVIDFFSVGAGQTRVGIITFSNKAKIRVRLNQYYNKTALQEVTNDPRWFVNGETNTTGALQVVRQLFSVENGDRPTVPNVCILITDGHSSHHEYPNFYQDPIYEATYLKDLSTRILVIGVTEDVYIEEIAAISSAPQKLGQSYWTSPSFEDLTHVVQGLMKETCEEECHDPPNCTLDIAFVLDSSGSIGEANPLDRSYNNWDVILRFVQDVVNFFKIGSGDTRVALITFSNGAKVYKKLDDNWDREKLMRSIETLPYSGGATDTAEGLRKLREDVFIDGAGDRDYVPNLAMVITDGKSSWKTDPNSNRHTNPIDEAYFAKQAGAYIVVVGITKNVDKKEIKEISSLPQREGLSYFLTPDFVEMSTVLNILATEFCLTIPPMPDIPEIDEGDPFCWVSVCNTAVDLVFVIDASGSIQKEAEKDYQPPVNTNWWMIMNFVARIMDFFKIGEDDTRIGIVTFSNYAIARVKLNEIFVKEDIKQATRDYSWYGGGRTHTEDAMKVLANVMFREENGDRPEVPNVVITITDGHSSFHEMPWRYGDPIPWANRVKSDGSMMFLVGVTDNVLEEELIEMSSKPHSEGETYWKAPDFDQLTPLIQSLMKQSCKRDCVRSPRCALDFVFLVDSSSNVISTANNDMWLDVLDFIKELMQFLRTGSQDTRFALVSYADQAEIVINLKQNEALTDQELFDKVSSLKQKGGASNTGAAINMARQEIFTVRAGERPEYHNIVFLMSDIYSLIPPSKALDPIDEAGYAQRDKIEIFAMGVSDLSDEAVLHEIASSSNRFANRTFWPRMEFNEVVSRLRNMIYQMCTTPPTRAPPPPPMICTERRDVVFALDTSLSVTIDDFESMRTFISAICKRLDIVNGKMRVALVLYGDTEVPQFYLSSFKQAGDVLDEIRGVKYVVGDFDPTETMRFIREVLFTVDNGDRPEASNTIVWVTDGETEMGPIAKEAEISKNKGIHIIGIGVGDGITREQLASIASYPEGTNVIHVDDYEDLVRKNLVVENLVCTKSSELTEPGTTPGTQTPAPPVGFTPAPPTFTPAPVDPGLTCPACTNGGDCKEEADTKFCDCPFGYAGKDCSQDCPIDSADIAFVIDASSSNKEHFQEQLEFIREVIMGLNIKEEGARCGLLIYSDDAEIMCDLKAHKSKVAAAEKVVTFQFRGGNANVAEAIRKLRTAMYTTESGDRKNVLNLAIIFTTGAMDDPEAAWEEAIKAREEGIELLIIGIGPTVNRAQLEALASDPGSHNVFTALDYNALNALTKNITTMSCSGGCAGFACPNGGTAVSVLDGCVCQCPPGRNGPGCEKSCFGKLDIALLIDTSGSITSDRFPMLRDVISTLTSKFEFEANGGETRLGAITFSDTAVADFGLDTYNSQQDIENAIKRFTFMGRRTNIAAALSTMQTQLFNRPGDRDDARNVALIFTDGSSNIDASNTIPEAIASRINGTHIIVFVVGDSSLELKGIASQPSSENLINVQSWTEFPSIIDTLVQSTCGDTDDCRDNPCRNGGSCVDDFNKHWCECPVDYTGVTCERRCMSQIDIVLVLDLGFPSRSQLPDIVMSFAQRLVHGLPVGLDKTRVGLMSYSGDVDIHFHLNSYNHKKSVLNAIAVGDTCCRKNTQEALKQTYAEMFHPSKGDRADARNVVVLVSDGNSNMRAEQTSREALNAKQAGVELYVAQVGLEPGIEEVNEVASDPDQLHVVSVPTMEDVTRAVDNLLEWLCQ